MLTLEIMRRMWPRGGATIPGLTEAIAGAAPSVFVKYGLTTDLLIAHAMAQFSHECGAGNEVVENLKYSAEGLIKTWRSRFTKSNAGAFAGHPEQIANQAYNGRMGNAVGSNDGWTFRGRGGSQVTGRDGYDKLGRRLSLDLIGNPDLVNDPNHFLECAVADFIICGCLRFAIDDDVTGVTRKLNGGLNGLKERVDWLTRWRDALNVSPTTVNGTSRLQESLNKLGANPPLIVNGSFDPATTDALKTFQRAHGLKPDGRTGPLTTAAIAQLLPAR